MIFGKPPCVPASCYLKRALLTSPTRATASLKPPPRLWSRSPGNFCAAEFSAGLFRALRNGFMSHLRDSSHTLVLNSDQRCSAALDFGLELYERGDRPRLTGSVRTTLAPGDLR